MAFAGPEPDLDEEKFPPSVDTILKLLAQQRQANETIALSLKIISQMNQENAELARENMNLKAKINKYQSKKETNVRIPLVLAERLARKGLIKFSLDTLKFE